MFQEVLGSAKQLEDSATCTKFWQLPPFPLLRIA